MKLNTVFSAALAISALLNVSGVALAAQGDTIAGYKLLTTITVPGGIGQDATAWVDTPTARLYLADTGNPRIIVIDTLNNVYLTSIALPAAPSGVLVISRSREVWVGLANSTVAVISTDTNTITGTISTGGTARAGQLAYDPIDRLIMIANDKDSPAFVTFINQQTRTVVKSVPFDGTQAPLATTGLGQPIWDIIAAKFYISVPTTPASPKGEIDEIDPVLMTVTRRFPTTCAAAGLAQLPSQRVITSCGDIIDISSGNLVTTIAGVGADEVWYNPGDKRVYFGGGMDTTTVPVIDAVNYQLIASLPAGKLQAAPLTNQTAQRLSADSDSNQIYVPVTGLGVEVWRNGAFLNVFPSPVPDSGPFGLATLTWFAPNADTIEIRLGSPSGQLFYHGANRGTVQTGSWVTDGMTFYLQDVSGGNALTLANTMATLTVVLSH